MGVVYLAHDPRLDRQVAIKVLPPDLTRDATAKQRFLQEAKAASALDHPNICTIHEINETDDGQLYLVMAHYAGETLKERIARGPLALDDAIDIATQAGQGLAEAHGAGIVHRDIKPANLLVTKSGTLKILDSGLAKLAGSEGVTQTGTTVGTVAYMSPEQARGEEVDHRTDIWSLGVVLYEMLSGHQPFQGDNLLAISKAIAEIRTPTLTGQAAAVNGVIGRALSKSESGRYQAVTKLLDELRSTPAAGILAPSEPKDLSIAVLPFTNMSADPELEFFSDGLTEEIIADLSKIHGLRVTSRTSIMRLKGAEKDLATIGRELKVRYLLEGSVRKAANKLRITAQLIDAADDVHVWAEKYNGSLADVFDIQERVSREIANALQIRLTPDDDRRVAERPIPDVRAFECYLREPSWRSSGSHKRALTGPLSFSVEALRSLERTHCSTPRSGWLTGSTSTRVLRQMSATCTRPRSVPRRRFNSIPRRYPAVTCALLVLLHRGQAQRAMLELGRALRIEPNNPDVLAWRASLLGFAGKDSTNEVARLLEVDPSPRLVRWQARGGPSYADSLPQRPRRVAALTGGTQTIPARRSYSRRPLREATGARKRRRFTRG